MANCRQPGTTGICTSLDWDARDSVPARGAHRPDPVCHDDSWVVVRYARCVVYVDTAWELAKAQYVGPSILKHAGEDFLELFKGILPSLLLALGGLLVTTGVGAVVGGFVGGVVGAGGGAV